MTKVPTKEEWEEICSTMHNRGVKIPTSVEQIVKRYIAALEHVEKMLSQINFTCLKAMAERDALREENARLKTTRPVAKNLLDNGQDMGEGDITP